MPNVIGETAEPKTAAVRGEVTNDSNEAGPGVHGTSAATGVLGESTTWHGVVGISTGASAFGVYGEAQGAAVVGLSHKWHGVSGTSESDSAYGVYGESGGAGVVALSHKWHGIAATSESTVGGAAVYAEAKGTGAAGDFRGNVVISGRLVVAGKDVGTATAGLEQQLPALQQQLVAVQQQSATLQQQVATAQQQINTLHQQVNALQQLVSTLQQKQANDVQGIAVSLATLAARVTALGG